MSDNEKPITPGFDGGRAVVVKYQHRGRRHRPGHRLGLGYSHEAFRLYQVYHGTDKVTIGSAVVPDGGQARECVLVLLRENSLGLAHLH